MNVPANQLGFFDQSRLMKIFHQDTHQLPWNNVEEPDLFENKNPLNWLVAVIGDYF